VVLVPPAQPATARPTMNGVSRNRGGSVGIGRAFQ
jgi:hypothetical protein